MNWDEITQHLEAPLNPNAVKPPPQGKYGEYVEALHVIREANRIFGFNGWSYSVQSVNLTNATQDGGKHRVGYFALVCVSVDGVTRTDVGHGQGFGKSEGDAHDSAVKEAVTDALKRALRTFGNTFGLALYEKDPNSREVGFAATDAEIDAAIDGINSQPTIGDLQKYYGHLYRDNKAVAEHKKVVEAKDVKKAEFEGRE